jgi:hypothetical protein
LLYTPAAWQQALTVLNQLNQPDAEQIQTNLATLDTHEAV